MSEAAPPIAGAAAAAAPADGFRLRGDPPQVMRLSRKALATLGAVSAIAIGGCLLYAFQPTAPRQSTELYNTDSKTTPDGLAAVPKDYGQAPKLGPPLPGDLGRPIVAAQQRMGADGTTPPPGSASASTPAAQAAAAAHQQVLQERDSARTSKLFLAADAPSGAAGSAGAALPPTPASPNGGAGDQAEVAAGNGQGEKRAFLKGDADRRTESAERLTAPSSPYVVLAGSVIPAALITGIRSDLPGQITAQVTQNV